MANSVLKKTDDDEMEIDLLALLGSLWRNALIILIVGLIFAGCAFGGTYFFMDPTYEATATFYVNNSTVSVGSTSFSISSGELSAAQSLVDTYIVILESRTTIEEVIAESGVPYTYDEMMSEKNKMIEAEAVESTGVFNVTVTSSSPTEAELIANTIAKVLPDRISEIVEGSSVRIVDYAIVPAGRSGPNYIKNTAIGGAVGIFLVCAIIIAHALLTTEEDTVIHSADDLVALYPDIPVLATIPDMRAVEKKGYYTQYNAYYGADQKEAK